MKIVQEDEKYRDRRSRKEDDDDFVPSSKNRTFYSPKEPRRKVDQNEIVQSKECPGRIQETRETKSKPSKSQKKRVASAVFHDELVQIKESQDDSELISWSRRTKQSSKNKKPAMEPFLFVPPDFMDFQTSNEEPVAKCELKSCCLCEMGPVDTPGWREMFIVLFQCIYENNPSKDEWLHLPTDVYEFLDSHWHLLNKGKPQCDHRKTLQDTLSHNPKFFEHGNAVFGKTGYWRLKESRRDKSVHPAKKQKAGEPEISAFILELQEKVSSLRLEVESMKEQIFDKTTKNMQTIQNITTEIKVNPLDTLIEVKEMLQKKHAEVQKSISEVSLMFKS